MNFDIKTEELENDGYVIALSGEVDLYTAPEFKQQLLEVIGKGGKEVVVDLTETTFIDSTTLGVLVGGVKRLRPNGGQLSLVCSDRNITKIFEITGLNKVFPIYESRDEAVGSIAQESQPSGLSAHPVALARHRLSARDRPRRSRVRRRGGHGLEGANPTVGKGLFVEKCGSCHTLPGRRHGLEVGPNLDDAYTRSREEGFDQSTLFRVTLDQIDLGRAADAGSDLVEGQDAVDVAAYVAGVAGLPAATATADDRRHRDDRRNDDYALA